MNKVDLIKTMKAELKFYALPRGMNSMSKSDLEETYKKAKELGLTKERIIMGKIKGWKKVQEGYGGTLITYVKTPTSKMSDLIIQKSYDRWNVRFSSPKGGFKKTFNTKKEALGFATNYMRANQKGQ